MRFRHGYHLPLDDLQTYIHALILVMFHLQLAFMNVIKYTSKFRNLIDGNFGKSIYPPYKHLRSPSCFGMLILSNCQLFCWKGLYC